MLTVHRFRNEKSNGETKMVDETIKVCIDRLLPNHLMPVAAKKAVAENSVNAPRVALEAGYPSLEKIALLNGKLWQP